MIVLALIATTACTKRDENTLVSESSVISTTQSEIDTSILVVENDYSDEYAKYYNNDDYIIRRIYEQKPEEYEDIYEDAPLISLATELIDQTKSHIRFDSPPFGGLQLSSEECPDKVQFYHVIDERYKSLSDVVADFYSIYDESIDFPYMVYYEDENKKLYACDGAIGSTNEIFSIVTHIIEETEDIVTFNVRKCYYEYLLDNDLEISYYDEQWKMKKQMDNTWRLCK